MVNFVGQQVYFLCTIVCTFWDPQTYVNITPMDWFAHENKCVHRMLLTIYQHLYDEKCSITWPLLDHS